MIINFNYIYVPLLSLSPLPFSSSLSSSPCPCTLFVKCKATPGNVSTSRGHGARPGLRVDLAALGQDSGIVVELRFVDGRWLGGGGREGWGR